MTHHNLPLCSGKTVSMREHELLQLVSLKLSDVLALRWSGRRTIDRYCGTSIMKKRIGIG